MTTPDLFEGPYWRGPRGKGVRDMLGEVQRELETRRRVYPRWIEQGKIDQVTAAYRIEVLADLAVLLEANVDK